MRLCKVEALDGHVRVGILEDDHLRFLDLEDSPARPALSEVLHAEHPSALARDLIDDDAHAWPLEELTLLPPLDRQEVWAAGVTYQRSEEARKKESVGAAAFYDLVYKSPRPELFFKANPWRCVGHGGRVRIRADSSWSVPEPELALVLSPKLKLVGFTIGNDMSARDIEGENPLYLPQAKVYDECCALGPAVSLADAMPHPNQIKIHMTIERGTKTVFDGSTTVGQMARSFDELIGWLGRECSFPHGAVLLTGTGIVPPDDFSLRPGDVIHIDVSGIGRLSNFVSTSR